MGPSFEIEFHRERPINPRAVRDLYSSEGWWPERQEQEIARVLSSDLAVGAWEGNQLVGFARVVSDQHFHAYIEDVVVRPDRQQMGIGSLLLTRLIEALQHIETISLFCQPELLRFYEHQGFRASSSQRVMHRKRSVINNQNQ
jgi:GNAT superfamily N-acetyltransferase